MGIHVYFIRLSEDIFLEIKDDGEKLANFLDRLLNDEDIDNNPKVKWVEKAWAGLFYLLYNMKYFSDDVNLSGTVLGEFSLYNKKYTLTLQIPENVERIYNHLKNFTAESLVSKYDAIEFSKLEIYPMDDRWDEDEIEYLLSHWEGLTEFYEEAAKNDEFIVIYWSI